MDLWDVLSVGDGGRVSNVVACVARLDDVAFLDWIGREFDLFASHVIVVLLLLCERLLMLHLGRMV